MCFKCNLLRLPRTIASEHSFFRSYTFFLDLVRCHSWDELHQSLDNEFFCILLIVKQEYLTRLGDSALNIAVHTLEIHKHTLYFLPGSVRCGGLSNTAVLPPCFSFSILSALKLSGMRIPPSPNPSPPRRPQSDGKKSGILVSIFNLEVADCRRTTRCGEVVIRFAMKNEAAIGRITIAMTTLM